MLFADIDLLDENLDFRAHQWVGVRDGHIAYVGGAAPEEGEAASFGEVYDGRGKLLMPAFYNVHSHAPMTLLRGYGLQTWSFWQDPSQLQNLYPNDWPTMVNNCRAVQCFGANTMLAAEAMARRRPSKAPSWAASSRMNSVECGGRPLRPVIWLISVCTHSRSRRPWLSSMCGGSTR